MGKESMPYLELDDIHGKSVSWFIEEGHYKTDRYGNVLSFSVALQNGGTEQYVLGEPGRIQDILNHFQLLLVSNHSLKQSLTRLSSMIGKELHAEHGKIGGTVAAHAAAAVLKHCTAPYLEGQHYYYDSKGSRAFHYPAKF